MPYTAEINRANPSCFVFLVDQSQSMSKPFGGSHGKDRAHGVADALNRLLQQLVLKCAKTEGIRDYFHVGVIGYGGSVRTALGGALTDTTLVPIGELANNPLRVEQRIRLVDNGIDGTLAEQTFRFPVWLEPIAEGKTPMCEAFGLAQDIVRHFLHCYPACYPPMVLNITDGAATDGDPEIPAQVLRSLESTDGNVQLFNAHLTSMPVTPIEYPDREDVLPSDYARMLFRMSSLLPPRVLQAARTEGFSVTPKSHGFVFNADAVAVIRFMDIGTRFSTSAAYDQGGKWHCD